MIVTIQEYPSDQRYKCNKKIEHYLTHYPLIQLQELNLDDLTSLKPFAFSHKTMMSEYYEQQ